MGQFREEIFSSIPLFADLSRSDKNYLSNHNNYLVDRFENDDFLIKEGAESKAFFILIRGAAKVTYSSSPDQIVTMLKPGDIFGEMSYLTGERRSANVIACSEVMVMRLSNQSIKELPPKVREIIKEKLMELMNERAGSTAPGSVTKENRSSALIDRLISWFDN